MTENKRTLFVQFEADKWNGEQLESLVNSLDAVIPDDCGVVALPEDVEYLTEDQVKDIANTLYSAFEDGNSDE